MGRLRPLGITVTLLLAIGCSADRPVNPSFPLTVKDAERALEAMEQEPRPLARPVVVLSGIHDPGLGAWALARRLQNVTTDDTDIVFVSFFGANTFESCRERFAEGLQKVCPEEGSAAAMEIDVVAISMGGLVARDATRPRIDGVSPISVRRLFTISTPHLGAAMAEIPTLDQRIVDMRAGSAFLSALNELTNEHEPEIIAYVRLGDVMVGEQNAAPPGHDPWWVPNIPWQPAHVMASGDPRLIADIARRLRGEQPYTSRPATPLPETTETPEHP